MRPSAPFALVIALCATAATGCTWFDPSWSEGGNDAFRSRVMTQHPIGTGSQALRDQLLAWGFESKAMRCAKTPQPISCTGKYPEDRLSDMQEEYTDYYGRAVYACSAWVRWTRDKNDNISKYDTLSYGCAGL